ncbi:hypothetical protein FLP10_12940 [Agromyces intestinalis]|uniref:Glycosyl hydrolase family 67 C-terminal domain-containing protein n=1 Tax=Agromyces intestinalis TaxID=2592652 RepID=A0A5C1YJG4_9MICO|nr:hypothetical protein [Agromyces intestinalis]QEO15227.1 hypothetical protein FLP10_12940 [Agromyces intestinalis]
MTKATRRGILAVVVAATLLALGAGIGVVVGDALGISVEGSDRMHPAEPDVSPVEAAVPPPAIASLDVPTTARVGVAVDELLDAVAAAPTREGELALAVEVEATATPTGTDADDAYRLEGDASSLRVIAATESGATRAIYDLAAHVRAGRSVAAELGEHDASALPVRLVDLGAVGVEADPTEWERGDDYSHVSDAFRDVYLADAPYVDEAALAEAYDDWDAFLRRSVAEGANAVAWPGFIEYVDFADAEDGPVYADGDPHPARAAALREAFGPFWDRAAELGAKVYLRTDMLALSPELDAYFDRRFGGADTEDPELWQVYADALDALYAEQPSLSGVMIRIGEGGDIYATPGWDFTSELAVRSVAAVRAMLTALTTQAEASDREVIFRTWSVGIGDVGDMHTDPASYQRVLDGISSPALIVSTKYMAGDFFSWHPLNETLKIGDQRRIVEFQSRREFEGFGAFPNDLGPEFQWALGELLAANPNIEGVWTWTQDGGPWRAGPMTLHLKAGFWQLADLNTRLSLALARDPGTHVSQVTIDWAKQFSDDPATVSAIAEAMAISREPIEHGLYLSAFAEQHTTALGLQPPPQMLLFQWDILTGDTATLDVIATIVGDRREESIREADEAVAAAERMRSAIEATDAASWRDPAERSAFIGAIGYEVDTLGLLGAYREMFLEQARWHDTESDEAHGAWRAARDDYVAAAAAHLAAYEGDVDHPAWNLTAAQLGVDRGDRDLAMAWAARVLLVLALVWVVVGAASVRTRLVRRPGAAGARASWLAATRPWRAREATLGLDSLDLWLLFLVPVALLVATRAVQTSFLSWTHLAVVLGAWVVFAIVVRLFVWRRSPWPVIAAVGGVVVLRCVVTLVALSFTGPGGYWYAFWTDPVQRVAYIAIAFALFVWVFVAAGWALSTQIGVRRATGSVLAAVGAGLALPSLVVAIVGLEQALTLWNDEMGLLPWGMSRILGITTFLEIPEESAWYAAGFGALVALVGALLAVRWRRPRAIAD